MNAARPWLGPANEASLAVSPSVLAQAALISHEGRCQFVFCCSTENLIIQANMVSFWPVYLLTKFSPPLLPLWPEHKSWLFLGPSCCLKGEQRVEYQARSCGWAALVFICVCKGKSSKLYMLSWYKTSAFIFDLINQASFAFANEADKNGFTF